MLSHQHFQLFIIVIISFIYIRTCHCVCEQNKQNSKELLCNLQDGENFTTINNFENKFNFKKLDITAKTDLKKLPENAFDYPTITDLKLYNIGTLTEININAFANLEYLENLSLVYIPLKLIRQDLLTMLNDLKDLQINSCQIEMIESGAFDNLIELIHLDLSYNQIETLQSDLFSTLYNLEQLKFFSNKIYTIGNNLFFKLYKLKSLDFGANKIDTVSIDMFKTEQLINTNPGRVEYESKIEILDLSFNSIQQFTKLYYLDLNLKSLNLRNNRIGNDIDVNVFQSIPNLESLYLGTNNFTDLNRIDWSYLTRLKKLELSYNNLVTFNGSIFKTMPYLIELDFGLNKISAITADMFQYTTNLRYLSLYSNKIQTVDNTAFSQMKRLKELIFSANEIVNIDSGAFLHTPLVKLDLNSNKISVLNYGIFDSLVSGTVGSRSRLLSLDLSSNQIEKLLTSTFESLKKLNTLTLSSNKITQIPDDFFTQMKQLQHLDLSYNKLKILPVKLFASLASLTRLELASNQIEQIDSAAFIGLNNLNFLNLRGNQLIFVHENLLNLPRLKVVSISDNRIKYLSKDLLHGPKCKVEELVVFNNRLTFIEPEFFDKTHLQRLYADRNPWLCMCLQRIEEALRRNNINGRFGNTDGTRPNCIVFKNNTCVTDLSYNDEIYAQYQSTLPIYQTLCADSFYC